MTNIDDRNTVLGKRAAHLFCDHRQQNIFGMAFNDDESSRKEKIGFGGVKKSAQKGIILLNQIGLALGQWVSLMIDNHHHGVQVRACRELRAVRAQQYLNLLAGLSLRDGRSPLLKHVHEERLMLRMKMRFRFLDEQKGELLARRLEQK